MRLVEMMNALKGVTGDAWKAVSEQKLDEIRTHPFYATQLDDMRRKADGYAAKPLRCIPYSYFKLFDETGDRNLFQGVYKEHRGALIAYAMAALIDGTHISDLEDAIWAVCDEYSWCLTAHFRYGGTNIPALLNPAPTAENKMQPYLFDQPQVIDLCAAQTAADLAEITALLGDKLAPVVVYRARKCIRERVLEPFMAINTPFWWETVPMNWAAVCGGGVGIAAMYMIDDADMLAPVLTRCTESMECYLSGFKADGVCAEGLGYWGYGFGHFMVYAELLCRRTGGKVNLFEEEITHKVALFYQNALLNSNNAVCFADCHEKASYEYYRNHFLHSIYPDVEVPAVQYAGRMMDNNEYFTPVSRNFLWSHPEYAGGEMSDTDIQYDETQWLISRRTFADCRVAFAAKGGNNDEPHNHNDLGSFVIDVSGEVLLGDLGGGMYNKDYFSDKRYTILVNGSQGHPVPMIAGATQKEGAAFAVKNYRSCADAAGASVEMDIAGGYDVAALASLVRRLHFSKETPAITIDDTYRWNGEAKEVTERFTTKAEPAVQADGSVLIRGKNKAVRLRSTNPACKWTVSADEYAESPENLHQKVWLIDTTATPADGETLGFIVTAE